MYRLLISLLFIVFQSQAQQTAGLFLHTEAASPGYTLLAPLQYHEAYLLDNCGRQVHKWTGTAWNGSATYLLDDGTLLRAEKSDDNYFTTGGKGGKLLQLDWDSEIIWSWEMTGPDGHPHHDIEYLDNGNILVLAWEIKSQAEAIDMGRDPEDIPDEIWSEVIFEIQPIGTDSATIVWEWHLWDHLIQDFDTNKPNFGAIAEHPELIDLNYIGLTGAAGADWIHLNSIAYNSDLDQIMVASRAFSEIWIIDHNTTTQTAAGHAGDLMYRWGNPMTYDQGTAEDQHLFTAHDAHWIDEGLEDAGKVMLFNNGIARPAGTYSTVEIITLPLNDQGRYDYTPNSAYGPETPDWVYTADDPESFFSKILSGAQRLENGNTLICEGMHGRIFEINPDGEKVWEYVNPVNQYGPVSQGDQAWFNHVFRAYRFAEDHPALVGRTLVPGEPLELNPLPQDCALTSSNDQLSELDWNVYPNPVLQILNIDNPSGQNRQLRIFDISGKLVHESLQSGNPLQVNLKDIPTGVYALQVDHQFVEKIIKNQ